MTLQTKVYHRKIFNWKLAATVLLIFLQSSSVLADEGWQRLKEGFEYKDLGSSLLKPWVHIHVFRIDPRQNQFSIITADKLSQKNASINEYAHYTNALLAINGGFFDPDFNPLGLRISNKIQTSPLKQISWWGIFYIKNNQAQLSNIYQFYRNKNIDFAIQSGPRLIINGKIPSLKPGTAERTALGITKDNKIIILVTDNASTTTTELAALMKAPPLSCKDALNLDGGNSSQLYVNIGNFKLSVHGFSNISDAVVVKSLKASAV